MSKKARNILKLNLKLPEDKNSLCSGQTSDGLDTYELTPRVETYLKPFDENYQKRPTVQSLHSTHDIENQNNIRISEGKQNVEIKAQNKFGLLTMVPTFMNLLGTTLYLRMGIMTAQSGIILGLFQVLLGALILSGTILSATALCTNGEMGTGGFYYLISRSLGPEIGAMFGILYFLTNAIMVAFSIVGVCLEVTYILQSFNVGIVEVPSGVNDQRIVGVICLIFVSLIPFISLDFEAKTQWVLFTVVLISLLDLFVGELLPPTKYQKVNGFVGWSSDVFTENLLPEWTNYTFFSIFSVFMSALCGDFTGVTMSSSLKNPNVAIPKGSLLAILMASLIYSLQIIFFGSTVVRYSTGNLDDYPYNNYSCNSYKNCNEYGLSNNQYLMSVTSALTFFGAKLHYIEPLFSAGILCVSISGALCAFIAAPRFIQAIGFDGLLPLTKWFSKPYGNHADPRRGYILTFFIALIFVIVNNFNEIANLITNCYLCTWCLVNISCFHSSYVKSSDWRPTFKYYNKWLSLLCGLVCFVLMFCIDWISSLILLAIMFGVWIIISFYKPGVNWGQTLNSQLYKTTISFANKLNLKSEHVKTFRPSILLFSGIPKDNMDLITMADDITRHRGMLIIGDVVCTDIIYDNRVKAINLWNNWLKCHGIKCFYKLIKAKTLSEGSDMLIQCCGLGSYLSPNIVMIGFKDNWKQCCNEEVVDYYNIVHHTFQMQKSFIIYRNHRKTKEFIEKENNEKQEIFNNPLTPRTSFQRKILAFNDINVVKTLRSINKLNFIDIYWLYDDGGLTLLVPYILSQNKKWKNCKLRIFAINDKQINDNIETEKKIKGLLNGFRIEFYDIIVLQIPDTTPYQSVEDIINNVNDKSNSLFSQLKSKSEIADSISNFQSKTNRYLSLRQLIEEHSMHSSLIVLTIEIPKKGVLSAHLFMYWLDMLSSGMPQFLFIRGNQTNVLTLGLE